MTEPKKRGRPRKLGTTVITVRMADRDYDVFCKIALRTGQDVRTVLRRALAREASAALA